VVGIHVVLAGNARQLCARGRSPGGKLLDCACQRLFQLRLELPAEAELQRLVNAAPNGYFSDLYERKRVQLPPKVQTGLDELLVAPNGGVVSGVWGVTGQWMQLRLIVRWSAQRPEFSMGQCPVDRSSQGRIDFQQLFFH